MLYRHCTPLCTLAGRLEDGSRSGESSDGGPQNGDVGRRTLMSHVARKSFDGRVHLGGDSCSGVSFHWDEAGSDNGGPSGARRQLGDSLALLSEIIFQFTGC